MNNSIQVVTQRIEDAIKAEMRTHTTEKFWVHHYGANNIHPKHLVYWIVVHSDKEKQRLGQQTELLSKLTSFLDEFEYPIEGRADVYIGFESHETVEREANGNFYHYWK
jgi:hypothetical protein